MEARAIAKEVRTVPRKARLVIDLIRGKSVKEADVILKNLNKESARIIRKVLISATANAAAWANLLLFPTIKVSNVYFGFKFDS